MILLKTQFLKICFRKLKAKTNGQASRLQKVCSAKDFPHFQQKNVPSESPYILLVFNSNVQAGLGMKSLHANEIKAEVLHDKIFDLKEFELEYGALQRPKQRIDKDKDKDNRRCHPKRKPRRNQKA